jgi:hypothetical protein
MNLECSENTGQAIAIIHLFQHQAPAVVFEARWDHYKRSVYLYMRGKK